MKPENVRKSPTNGGGISPNTVKHTTVTSSSTEVRGDRVDLNISGNCFSIISSKTLDIGQLGKDTPAPEDSPSEGYERPFTVQDLLKAFNRLPPFLANALLDPALPAIVYATYEASNSEDGFINAGLKFNAFEAFVQGDNGTEKRISIAEIGLYDFHCSLRMGKDSSIRIDSLFNPMNTYNAVPFAWNDGTQEIFKSEQAKQVIQKIAENLKSVNYDLVTAQGMIHEIGHVLWILLPEKMKNEWHALYTMDPPCEISGIYLRSRVYAREDPVEFSIESFCDKWACYILKNERDKLADIGRTIRDVETQFMEGVVDYFRTKLERGFYIHELIEDTPGYSIAVFFRRSFAKLFEFVRSNFVKLTSTVKED